MITTPHVCYSTDKGLSCLTRILRKTEVLELTKLRELTNKGLKSIASRSLTFVNLSESVKVSDDGLIQLVRSCPNIEKLSLCELDKLTDKSLTQVAKILGDKLVSYSNSYPSLPMLCFTLSLFLVYKIKYLYLLPLFCRICCE